MYIYIATCIRCAIQMYMHIYTTFTWPGCRPKHGEYIKFQVKSSWKNPLVQGEQFLGTVPVDLRSPMMAKSWRCDVVGCWDPATVVYHHHHHHHHLLLLLLLHHLHHHSYPYPYRCRHVYPGPYFFVTHILIRVEEFATEQRKNTFLLSIILVG